MPPADPSIIESGGETFQTFWPPDARKFHLRRPDQWRSLCRAWPYEEGMSIDLSEVAWMMCRTCAAKAKVEVPE